jgi:alkylhydroperoxidase family enzyme
MTWVQLRAVDDVDGPARAAAESGVEQYGQLLNTWGALLNRPEIFAAYLPFLRAVAGPGEVDARTKDLSALLVGWLNHCRYTVSHRAASASRNGVPEADVQSVVAGDWDGFDAPLRAVLELTRQLTVQPTEVPWTEAPQCVDPAVLAELSTHFTDAQLVELTMNVSVWNALSRFHRVMGFELDMPAPPPGCDPG